MMRRTTNRQWARGGFAFLVICLSLLVTGAFQPAMAATFPVSPAVTVHTSSGQLYGGFQSSCTYLNYFYAFWVNASGVLYVSSSTDGQTWSSGTNLMTLASMGTPSTANGAGLNTVHMACTGNVFLVVWQTVNAGSACTASQTNTVKWATGVIANGAVTMGSTSTGPLTNSGAAYKCINTANALSVGCVSYFGGNVYYCTNSGTSGHVNVIQGNTIVDNASWAWASAAPPYTMAYSGASFMIWLGSTCSYAVSSDGVTWPSSLTTISATFCTSSEILAGIGTGNAGLFFIPSGVVGHSYVLQFTSGGTLQAEFQWQAATTSDQTTITTDGLGNFVVISCSGTTIICVYATTSNTWASISAVNSFTLTGNKFGSASSFMYYSIQSQFSQTLEAFAIESLSTSATFTVYATLFGIPSAGSSTAQTLNIGSCPTKNTATTTLVNNTEYFYTQSAISPASFNAVNTFVASVTSATAPQTLSIGIYATLNTGAVSGANTMYLIAAFSKSLTAGTTNSPISWQPNVGLSSTIVGSIPTGATIGIALLGTNKIKINQSSLAGMTTATTTGGALASTLTALTSGSNQLYFCSSISYQQVFTTTATTTTTVSTTTTSTTTVNGSGPVPGASVNPNLYMALAIIATLFLVPLKFAGFAGAILGAIVGFGISIAAGLLPTVYIIVLVVGLVAAFFFLRTMNAPGGGGV